MNGHHAAGRLLRGPTEPHASAGLRGAPAPLGLTGQRAAPPPTALLLLRVTPAWAKGKVQFGKLCIIFSIFSLTLHQKEREIEVFYRNVTNGSILP